MTRSRTSRVDDQRIVALRLTGRTQQAIADELGVNVDVVRRHLRRPEVEQAISDARSQTLAQTSDTLLALARASLGRLGKIVQEGSDGHAVAASRVLLTCALAWYETANLEQRLTALEQAQDAAGADVLRWRA